MVPACHCMNETLQITVWLLVAIVIGYDDLPGNPGPARYAEFGLLYS